MQLGVRQTVYTLQLLDRSWKNLFDNSICWNAHMLDGILSTRDVKAFLNKKDC